MCKLTEHNLNNIAGSTIQKYHVEDIQVKQELFSDSAKRFNVTITEKLQKVITVEAESREEAEQIVSDKWNDSQWLAVHLRLPHFFVLTNFRF